MSPDSTDKPLYRSAQEIVTSLERILAALQSVASAQAHNNILIHQFSSVSTNFDQLCSAVRESRHQDILERTREIAADLSEIIALAGKVHDDLHFGVSTVADAVNTIVTSVQVQLPALIREVVDPRQ